VAIEQIGRVFSEGSTEVELNLITKSGNPIPFHFSEQLHIRGNQRYLVGVGTDITDRRQAEDKLKHLATHDVLTGLPTRLLCMEFISSAIATAQRHKNKAAVLFIDLDGFKLVNDTLGHDAGDDLLKLVSKRIVSLVRKVDKVARIGGDEFVVILENIQDRAGIEYVAKELIIAISSPFNLPQGAATVGASIGISIYPETAESVEDLLKSADTAMYSVKGSGKNNYSFADR